MEDTARERQSFFWRRMLTDAIRSYRQANKGYTPLCIHLSMAVHDVLPDLNMLDGVKLLFRPDADTPFVIIPHEDAPQPAAILKETLDVVAGMIESDLESIVTTLDERVNLAVSNATERLHAMAQRIREGKLL